MPTRREKDDPVIFAYTVYERIYGLNPENYEKNFVTVKISSDSSSKIYNFSFRNNKNFEIILYK